MGFQAAFLCGLGEVSCAEYQRFVGTCGVVGIGWDFIYPAGGEPCEGGGFYPLGVEIKAGAAVQGDVFGSEQVGKALHQCGVLDAAAADIDIARAWGSLKNGFGDGFGGELDESALHIKRGFVAA